MRQRALLKQTMHIATHQMADLTQQVDSTYLQYQAALEEQRANTTWRDGAGERFKAPAGGTTLLQALDEYLQAIDSSVMTNQQAAQLAATYNIELAQLQEAMGVILEDQGIQIANDPVTKAKQTIMADAAACPNLKEEELPAGPATQAAPSAAPPVPLNAAPPEVPSPAPAAAPGEYVTRSARSIGAGFASAASELKPRQAKRGPLRKPRPHFNQRDSANISPHCGPEAIVCNDDAGLARHAGQKFDIGIVELRQVSVHSASGHRDSVVEFESIHDRCGTARAQKPPH